RQPFPHHSRPWLAEVRGRCIPAKTSASPLSIPHQRLPAPLTALRAQRLREFSRNSRGDSSGKAGIKCTPTGSNKKVGLRPLIRATRFRANLEYIPPLRQKQVTCECGIKLLTELARGSKHSAGF